MKHAISFCLLLFAINFHAQSFYGPNPCGGVGCCLGANGSNWFLTPACEADVGVGPHSFSRGVYTFSFQFNIPLSATITGVEAQLTYTPGLGAGQTPRLNDSIVRLVVNNVELGNNKGQNTLLTCCSRTYGGVTDLWGLSAISPTLTNAPYFGFSLYTKNNTDTLGQLHIGPNINMKIYYSSGVGINEIQSSNDVVKAYYFDHKFFIYCAIKDAEAEIEIYSPNGQIIKNEKIINTENNVGLAHLLTGIYCYRIKNKNGILKRGKFLVNE